MECKICHRDLPESDFYPSTLKKGLRHCKKCCYERWSKKSTKKYQQSLKELPEHEFELYYGGYTICILNNPRPYKYTIKGTNGYFYQSNDSQQFMKELQNIIEQYIE